VVFRTRGDIDRAFRADIERLLHEGRHPAIATHDEDAIAVTCRIAASIGLQKDAFEFQMLYGVRTDLQERLVRDGYLVRCYVPYGGDWYRYVLGCLRRLPGGILQRARRLLVRTDQPSTPRIGAR
jgi:proline dehydrogenase